MLELPLRCGCWLTVLHLSACATRTPCAPCAFPAASEPVASAAPDATHAARAPSSEATPPAAIGSEPAPPSSETARAPSPHDAAAFNGWLAAHEHASDLPLLVAHAFAGIEARNVVVSVSYASGEAALGATATVTIDGLLDDSVRGEELVLDFARDAVAAPWRLTQVKRRVRCWQGRGHAELSTAPCT